MYVISSRATRPIAYPLDVFIATHLYPSVYKTVAAVYVNPCLLPPTGKVAIPRL